MNVKALADKYISEDGTAPTPRRDDPPQAIEPAAVTDTVTISSSDYARLVEAAQCDRDIMWCEHCGAWLDAADPILSTGDVTACVWYATGYNKLYKGQCRSDRALTK